MRPCLTGVEDPNVSGMMKNHCLARAAADTSFGESGRQLTCNCAWYGIEMVVIPRFEATSGPRSARGWLKEEYQVTPFSHLYKEYSLFERYST